MKLRRYFRPLRISLIRIIQKIAKNWYLFCRIITLLSVLRQGFAKFSPFFLVFAGVLPGIINQIGNEFESLETFHILRDKNNDMIMLLSFQYVKYIFCIHLRKVLIFLDKIIFVSDEINIR